MSSAVEICNLALGYTGQEPISSLTENTQRAKICFRNYQTERDNFLADHDWSFARKNVKLTRIEITNVYSAEAYIFPADTLVTRDVYVINSEGNVFPVYYKTELAADSGGVDRKCIFTKHEDAYMAYTARIEDTTKFSSQFYQALAYRMASVIAPLISRNAKLTSDLFLKAVRYSAIAKSSDKTYSKPIKKSVSWNETRVTGRLDQYGF